MRMSDTGKGLAAAGAVMGMVGLMIQFPITMGNSMNDGRTLLGSFWFFISSATILTNGFVVIVYLAHLIRPVGLLRFFAQPVVTATAVTGIVVVMVTNQILLTPWDDPQGWAVTANIILHYLAAPIMIIWWFISGRTGWLRYHWAWRFLVWPCLYLAHTGFRAWITGEYPYSFLNPNIASMPELLGSIAVVAGLFLALGYTIIFFDKKLKGVE